VTAVADGRQPYRAGTCSSARLAACRVLLAGMCAFAALGAIAAKAIAQPSAAWTITATSEPTNFERGDNSGRDVYNVVATNNGAAPTDGSTITVTDTLPAGVTLDPSGVFAQDATLDAISCAGEREIVCTAPGPLAPGETMVLRIPVDVEGAAPASVTDVASVSGGGAAPASTSEPTAIGAPPPATLLQSFETRLVDPEGLPSEQAGSHPFSMTVSFTINSKTDAAGDVVPVEDVKDVEAELPAGVSGYPDAVPFCSTQAFYTTQGTDCPSDTAVGIARFLIRGSARSAPAAIDWEPIWNLQPPAGVPAEFGIHPAGFLGKLPVVLQTRVRTGGDYGITVVSPDVTEQDSLYGATMVFWGVPAESSHDSLRGHCLQEGQDGGGSAGVCPAGVPPKPLLTLPTSCGSPLTSTLRVDSWQEPGAWDSATSTAGPAAGLSGCGELGFAPSLQVAAEPGMASSPSGLSVQVRLPQNEDATSLAEADLKRAVVTLPAGMAISPSAANGLGACSPEEIGLNDADAPSCPESAKVGTAEATSPSLEAPLQGSVYVAQQGENPFGSLLALYVVLEGDGVLVKLAGEVALDPTTGQITTSFDDLPQQTVSDMKLHFFGGARAPLVSPPICGTYTAVSLMSSWAAPFAPEATPSSSFKIDEECAPRGFTPSFSAGTVDNQAAASSAFTLELSRGDHEQDLRGIQVVLPPGLLGMLSRVTPCGEPQAQQGQCPPASQIGTTTVAAGAGTAPVYLPVAGQPPNPVYLTDGYRGAPFGLSIVVPAVAGPFDLGTVVVRAAITVDARNSQITITSDPLPQILDGVPLDVRAVDVAIDRQGFMINPTSCQRQAIEAVLTSAQGASTTAETPFQAASCANLRFAPKVSASTSGNGSIRGNGASLDVRVNTAQGPPDDAAQQAEANIRKFDVQLPLALPSRLGTLQQACTEAQFAANAAGCPAASDVGTALAHSPVLGVPLEGPAYIVSHGGAAFPELEIVLQGQGVVIELQGTTQITHGVTYSHFEALPDAPVTSFELKLPEGAHSLLAAYVRKGNLCTPTKTVTVVKHESRRLHGRLVHYVRRVKRKVVASLSMPTTIEGQNGAIVKQITPVTISGCARTSTRETKVGKVETSSGRRS